MPSWDWTEQAVDGNAISGVTVPTTTRSISFACTPAAFRAAFAALEAMSEVGSSTAILRSFMPVRVAIQSSEVSTIFSRSWLVSTLAGTYEPVPMTLDLNIR